MIIVSERFQSAYAAVSINNSLGRNAFFCTGQSFRVQSWPDSDLMQIDGGNGDFDGDLAISYRLSLIPRGFAIDFQESRDGISIVTASARSKIDVSVQRAG